MFSNQKSAVDFFEYLKEYRHVLKPTGRYEKLAADLERAKKYAIEQMGEDDSGAFNFDSASISLPRWWKKLVINAAKMAGVNYSKHRCSYLFSIPESGDCLTRTRAAEAMGDFLKNIGYDASVFYMLD